jgi:hypothetical protein
MSNERDSTYQNWKGSSHGKPVCLAQQPDSGAACRRQLMGVLDFSIVNVALPSIQRNFHLAPADLQWVVSVYALVFALQSHFLTQQ